MGRSQLTLTPVLRRTGGTYDRWLFSHIDCLIDLNGICETEVEKLKLSIYIDSLDQIRKSEQSVPEQNHNGYSVVGYTMVAKRFKLFGTEETEPPICELKKSSSPFVTNTDAYIVGSDGDSVLKAPINPDGTLGSWTTGASLPTKQ